MALVNKCDISGFIDYSDLDKTILGTKVILITKAILATKSILKARWKKIVKLHVFDSSCIHGETHFEDDGIQNYLVL